MKVTPAWARRFPAATSNDGEGVATGGDDDCLRLLGQAPLDRALVVVSHDSHLPSSTSTPLAVRVSRWHESDFGQNRCQNRATLIITPAGVPIGSHVALPLDRGPPFPWTAQAVLHSLYHVVGASAARSCAGNTLWLALPFVESRQQANGGFPKAGPHLCTLRVSGGLCILCRLCLSRGGRVRHFRVDHHILTDIRDLVRQFLISSGDEVSHGRRTQRVVTLVACESQLNSDTRGDRVV